MLNRVYQTKFVKDLKLLQKRDKDFSKLSLVIDFILNQEPLPPKYRNHKLKGQYNNNWECHIEPDWLLIYMKIGKDAIFARTGSHSDLFK